MIALLIELLPAKQFMLPPFPSSHLGFDAFLVTGAVLVVAATARILLRFLPGERG